MLFTWARKTFTRWSFLSLLLLLLFVATFIHEPVPVLSQDNTVYLPFLGRSGPPPTATATATVAPTATATATVMPTPTATAVPGTGPTVSNNLAVSAATYLGGAGSDAANAVDVAPDRTIVLGGSMPGHNPSGATPTDLLGGGNGVVLRLDATGRSVLSIARIGGVVNDLEVRDDGSMVVCGDFGIAVLNASANAVAWNANPGTGSRCAIGQDGTVAVLVSGAAHVYNATGTPIQNWSIAGSTNDIALTSAHGAVIATGFKQVGNVQIPFIRAWGYDGTFKWTSYDFASAPGLGADSRGQRIAIGRDGQLYFAGSINGGTGVSVFSRDPKDITVQLGADRYIRTDLYNNPTNVGSVSMSWYGRYNPADGTLELGQSLLTRRSNGAGNSIAVNAITADPAGNVYLAGSTAATIQNRDTRQVAGITVGPYEIGEAYFLVVSADFRQRFIWTTFTNPSVSAGGSPANGVAVRNGIAAIAITLTKGQLITHQALQSAPATLPDTYLAVWPVQ